ncbi:MAG: lipase/acyltransferase domain-containing protein [Nevskiales bacterium]
MLKRLLTLTLLAMAAACGGGMLQPDLQRLYMTAKPAPQPPVILIPGLLGSKLRDRQTGEEVWPGGWHDILFSSYPALRQEIDPVSLELAPSKLEAFDITEAALGQNIYRPIMRTLEEVGGYQRSLPGVPAGVLDRRYYVLSYDWRQDNVQSTRALHALIGQIQRDYKDPKLKVDIIAHSMGGLVARYYLRYGTKDVLNGNDFSITHAGAANVNKLLLLGTPNLGSIESLHSFLNGFRILAGRIPTEDLATMPSGLQLFPHPLNVWLIKPDGSELVRDLFDVETWRRFQWSVFDPKVMGRMRKQTSATAADDIALRQRFFAKQLERARRFVWSLSVKEPTTPIRYIVFGGACELTPARVLVEEDGGDSLIRMYPEDIRQPMKGVAYDRLMLEPGDGTVTKASLLARASLDPSVPRHRYSFFPLAYAFFLCETHKQLTNNINFQDNLLNALLERNMEFSTALPLRRGGK